MKRFFLLIPFCAILLAGCGKTTPRERWEYKTIVIDDGYYSKGISGDPKDIGRFSGMNLQKELQTQTFSDEYSSQWEVCGCFLEPRKDPQLIVLLKRRW